MALKYKRVASLKTPEDFQAYLDAHAIDLPFDMALSAPADNPLAQGYRLKDGFKIGNRFAVLPMEGWDGTPDGKPSDETRRRWQRFGESGAKFIWGGEAVAVRFDGRANPNQLIMSEATMSSIADLQKMLLDAHQERHEQTDDLLLGLQLTHSGRFCKPSSFARSEPRTLYAHPLLDKKFKVRPEDHLMNDDTIKQLIDDFIIAAKRASRLGFHFVDVKHCHGYLGHEFLTAIDRPGPFGGSFENRTRFLRDVVAGVRAEAPGLKVGVRLSAFDLIPYTMGPGKIGVPEATDIEDYPYAFGSDGAQFSLDEPRAFLKLLEELDIELVCITIGSPYYTPHTTRPAFFPPSDGYLPPEDPLVGVARHIQLTAALKADFPNLCFVGSGYSYLQEYLPHVAQHVIRTDRTDFVGLGRMVLSYPELPADILSARPFARKLFCRTFSDCTTAPRNGLISGCYPLDAFYKQKAEAKTLKEIKKNSPV